VTAAPGVRTTGTDPRWAALIRWAAGVIFLIFGTAGFSGHAAELTSLRHYALQDPDVFVSLAGAVRVAGGLLLVIGLLTRLAALALAADMIGAIVISGPDAGSSSA
jgi:putative oxidoreductase